MARIFTCPCRASEPVGLTYDECCGRYHQGYTTSTRAPTAEALMRSRYSAYALAISNNPQGRAMLTYLHATWHPMTNPDDLEISPTQWLGLEVVDAQESGDAAVVEFTAHYKASGLAGQMHETSRFVRDAQAGWLYIDGDVGAAAS